MRTLSTSLFILGLACIASSCQHHPSGLTDSEKIVIADSARAVVKKVFEYANQLDYKMGLQFYSGDPDTRYIDNGSIYPVKFNNLIAEAGLPEEDYCEIGI